MRSSPVQLILSCLLAVALTANSAFGVIAINVLQIESPESGSPVMGYQYAPVNFNGATSLVSGGVTYHALSGTGATYNTYSSHASYVLLNRLLPAAGVGNSVTDVWCLTHYDFLDKNKYVRYSSPSQLATRPDSVDSSIKIINNSWATSYFYTSGPLVGQVDPVSELDAIRRVDYMIHRQDLLMTSGAVSPWPYDPSPLVWASFNGIAVRGTQVFTPTDATGIGKLHADLWGPKYPGTGIPDEQSSFETPGVAGYAAALLKVADANGWNNGTNGLRHEVIKSILMTGADKTATAFTTNGFTSWNSNGVNNLDNLNGAGRVNYTNSKSVLNGGQHSMATVTGTTVNTPIVTTATAGWWYEPNLSANGTRALVLNVTQGKLTDLTATLAWDVTQTETTTHSGSPRLDTTDTGVIFANLDLELRPVTYTGGSYTIGPSLGIAGLMSKSTNDNVEHLYFTNNMLAPGYYAFVVSNNSSFDWNYGFSYRYSVVPEPGTLLMFASALILGLTYLGARRRCFMPARQV